MYVEAFTHAKDPATPHANEDRWLAHESRLFAVIDGVTDKSGAPLEDGSSRGQAAGRLLDERLRELPRDAPADLGTAELVAELTAAISAEYSKLGIFEAVLASPNLRFGAQLAAAFAVPDGWRVLAIGDCGVRVNRPEAPPVMIGGATPHDDIVALWRAAVVGHVMRRAGGVDDALAIGREYALVGTRRFLPEFAAYLGPSDHATLAATAEQDAIAAHLTVAPTDVRSVLALGINGLGVHRNRLGALGFPCLDGTEVPLSAVTDLRFAAHEVERIELFSDGYFGAPPPGDASVAAWERHLRHVEASDPHKIGPYRSTKGSSEGKFTDDRTVLIVGSTARREVGA